MPATSFGRNDPRTQTIWSLAVFEYAMQNMILTKFFGKTKNDLIHVNMDLLTKPGGTIIYYSKSPMSGSGQGDDGNTTGNEEALKRRNMSVAVHERAHSYVSAGKISEQLTATNIREDGKEDLGDWYAEAMENDLATCAAGLYNENSSGSNIQTINESYPTSDRIHYGGQNAAGTTINSNFTSDALLSADTTANNLMGTKVLELIKRKAIAATPRIRPISIREVKAENDNRGAPAGRLLGKWHIVLLDPLHIKSIKAETGTTGWKNMVALAQQRGNLNPIFSGASFIWDGMVCMEYDRIAKRTGAGSNTLAEGFLLNAGRTLTTDLVANERTVARALFMGAQAIAFGWAQRLQWHEDMIDARKPKVVVDALYGVKRTIFNAHGTSTPGSTEAIYCIDTEVQVD